MRSGKEGQGMGICDEIEARAGFCSEATQPGPAVA